MLRRMTHILCRWLALGRDMRTMLPREKRQRMSCVIVDGVIDRASTHNF